MNKLICISGPSGSGKSSLAFHTLYAESKRRFFNSFPNYMKLFSERPAPVDVDVIHPVLPVFALPQINPVIGARSCVSDVLRLTEYFQTIFHQLSHQYCSVHQVPLKVLSPKEVIDKEVKGESKKAYIFVKKNIFLENFKNLPFPSRCFKSGQVEEFDENADFWELLRIKTPVSDSAQKKIKELGALEEVLFVVEGEIEKKIQLNSDSKCPKCDEASVKQQVSHFNPYNALGACNNCGGYGATLEYDWEKLVNLDQSVEEEGVKFINYKRFAYLKPALVQEMKKKKFSLKKPISELGDKFKDFLYAGSGKYHGFNKLFRYLESKKYKPNVRIFIRSIQKEVECETCKGTRLSSSVIRNRINKIPLDDILSFTLEEAYHFFKGIKLKDDEFKKVIESLLLVLEVANKIGLGHLKLLRKTKSVSAGEYQRLLLVKYLSYKGTGALFVFDEPSLGLSLKEQQFILNQFKSLIADGNTVLLVEHSPYLIGNSDLNIQIGPGAGHLGGQVVYYGNPKKEKRLPKPNRVKSKGGKVVRLDGVEVYGKKYDKVEIKTNQFVVIKGESGCGKSSLFVHALGNHISLQASGERITPVKYSYKKEKIPSDIEEVIFIDSNLNKFSSRSTVGTLTDLSSILRKHYAALPVSKVLNLEKGHFSPNSQLGQCSECEGKGHKVIEMQYLEDIVVECEVCKGKKLKPHLADISDNFYTIADAYQTPVKELFQHIKLTPKYRKILEYMEVLNLDYLSLERKIQSLSGGEKQRIYLLSKLVKSIENSLIIVENITFGLSQTEIIKLCEFFDLLVLKNNTIVVIDQNPLLDSYCDQIINL